MEVDAGNEASASSGFSASTKQKEDPSRRTDHASNHEPKLFDATQPIPQASNDAESSKTLDDEKDFPEGGLQAWLVVFGAWCGM